MLSTWLLSAELWEALAVGLALGYLLLATRENSLCWYFAFFSTAIYTVLFWDASLLMESLLNIYYMGMAVYGWLQWRRGGDDHQGVSIRRLSLQQHGAIIVGVVLLSAVSGYLLRSNGSAAWPYLDSFTTWASVITTFMVARKVLENWLYWVVIDALSIVLYIDRGFHMTALLFVAYIGIAIYGYVSWARHYRQASEPVHA